MQLLEAIFNEHGKERNGVIILHQKTHCQGWGTSILLGKHSNAANRGNSFYLLTIWKNCIMLWEIHESLNVNSFELIYEVMGPAIWGKQVYFFIKMDHHMC